MKKQIILALSLVLLAFSLQNCKPEKKLELGPKANQMDGINGTWSLFKTEQIDVNVQLAFVESDTLLDVSSVMIDGTPMDISFDKITNKFNINSGSGASLFPALSGDWAFDNKDYPSFVQLTNGGNTYSYKLMHAVRPQDPYLILKVNKMCNGKRTVSYNLWFSRK